jgi:anti-anti-sigma factor
MTSSVEMRFAAPSVMILSLVGEHELQGAESLKVALARAAIRANDVIVDLTRCELIEPTVIAALLDTQSIVSQDAGRFAVVLPAAPNAVTRLAALAHLDKLFPTFSSLDEALARMTFALSTTTAL